MKKKTNNEICGEPVGGGVSPFGGFDFLGADQKPFEPKDFDLGDEELFQKCAELKAESEKTAREYAEACRELFVRKTNPDGYRKAAEKSRKKAAAEKERAERSEKIRYEWFDASKKPDLRKALNEEVARFMRRQDAIRSRISAAARKHLPREFSGWRVRAAPDCRSFDVYQRDESMVYWSEKLSEVSATYSLKKTDNGYGIATELTGWNVFGDTSDGAFYKKLNVMNPLFKTEYVKLIKDLFFGISMNPTFTSNPVFHSEISAAIQEIDEMNADWDAVCKGAESRAVYNESKIAANNRGIHVNIFYGRFGTGWTVSHKAWGMFATFSDADKENRLISWSFEHGFEASGKWSWKISCFVKRAGKPSVPLSEFKREDFADSKLVKGFDNMALTDCLRFVLAELPESLKMLEENFVW